MYPLAAPTLTSAVIKLSGAPTNSFCITGLIAACGQTREHWLHWIHFVGSQTGIDTATPRFSSFVVAVGTVPFACCINTDTGNLSPSWSNIGLITSKKYLSLETLATTAPSVVVAHDSGYLISVKLAIASSIAAIFISTTACPFFVNVFTTNSFI